MLKFYGDDLERLKPDDMLMKCYTNVLTKKLEADAVSIYLFVYRSYCKNEVVKPLEEVSLAISTVPPSDVATLPC